DKRFGVGPACRGEGSCLPVPSGVMALVTLLYHLDQQQGESGPCAKF
ncbi:MAG: hypothetical protein JWN04_5797, partial [Myxococcaceae bacterium]|nr:hypothetical protein [Myxococcaceae bacterium]